MVDYLRNAQRFSGLSLFLCISEPVSAREDAEVLRLPIPISATSKYNSSLHYYCIYQAWEQLSGADLVLVNIQVEGYEKDCRVL